MNRTIALTNATSAAHWTGQGTIADARQGTATHQWLTIVVGVYVLFGLAGFFAASGPFLPY